MGLNANTVIHPGKAMRQQKKSDRTDPGMFGKNPEEFMISNLYENRRAKDTLLHQQS
jgi:hypothetical protein